MPQVSQRFGPINQTVVLDGSGAGAVSFQATGGNARITNLFVRVGTSNKQAQAVVYKGFIANGNQISNTNSGSTGAACHGTIDLLDGETAYVQWTGGDAGATATATFTGYLIPFDVIGASQLTWDDPIAASDGSLIYPALKSPNYVMGVSGWKIDRDGNAEFYNGQFRGSVLIPGSNNSQLVISTVSGVPSLSLRPADIPGYTSFNSDIGEGNIYAISADGGTQGSSDVRLVLSAPDVTNGSLLSDSPFMNLISGAYDGSSPPIVEIGKQFGILAQQLRLELDGDADITGIATVHSDVNVLNALNVAGIITGLSEIRGVTSLIRLVQQSAQAIASGGQSALTFGAGSHDITTGTGNAWHSTSVNTSRVTPTLAGVYDVRGLVSMAIASGGNYTQVAASIFKNGTRINAPVIQRPDPGTPTVTAQVSAYVQLNGTTDYVEVVGAQVNSGGTNQNTNAGAGFLSTLEVAYKSS